MSKEITGTRDKTFDVLGCVYHALRSAQACARYVEDAKRGGDVATVRYFEGVLAANRDIAERGKALLRDFLGSADERSSDEIVDEASDESFPASDAPAHY